MRIGILTGGGDCPGLNAVIRSAVRKATYNGWECVGILDGWRGLIEGRSRPLAVADVRGILTRGGTILGSSGVPGEVVRQELPTIRAELDRLGIDGLVVIGGEGTMAGAELLADDGFLTVGVPKTIDNDLSGTDVTFGFDTAVNVATEAIDRLHTTAESHHRILVVEVMGRNAGWIALHAGIAGGANIILIPEVPFDLDQVTGWVESRFRSSYAPVVVVSERAMPADQALIDEFGTVDPFGATYIKGVGTWLAGVLEERTGREARTTVLGHVQRGGTPSAFDRDLATRWGLAAIDVLAEGRSGRMVALHGPDVVDVSISEAVGTLKTVPRHRYDEVAILFG
jgi:6-phosphofructokinase 1